MRTQSTHAEPARMAVGTTRSEITADTGRPSVMEKPKSP